MIPDAKEYVLFVDLVEEEMDELRAAVISKDVIEVADALGDMIYVIAQQADKWGYPIDELLEEIHRSNMSKLDEDYRPIYREDGKVLKGVNFSEPNIKAVLEK